MEELTTITKKEADKYAFRDIKTKLTYGFVSPGAIVAGFEFLNKPEGFANTPGGKQLANIFETFPSVLASELLGGALIAAGIGMTAYCLQKSYDLAKEYITDPSSYLHKRHNLFIDG